MSNPSALVAKATAWSALGATIAVFLNFIALALIARTLGPEAFGITAASWVVVGLPSILISSSFTESLYRLKEPEPGHYDAVFWILMGFALVAVGIIATGHELIAGWMEAPELADVLSVAALSLPLTAIYILHEAHLMRDLRMRIITKAELAGAVAANLAGVAGAFLGLGVWSLVAMPLVSQVVQISLLWPVTRWRPGFQARYRHVRDLYRFGLTVLAIKIFEFVETAIPRTVVAISLGTVALGHYSLAYRFFENLSYILTAPVTRVAMPAVARLKDDMASLRTLLWHTNRFVSLLATPGFTGLAVVAPLALPLLVGEAWVPAAILLQVFCLIGVVRSIGPVQMPVLRGVGRPGLHLRIMLCRCAFTGLLAPMAAPFGAVAIAAVIAARELVVWFPSAVLVARLTRDTVWRQFKVTLPTLVATALMVACVVAFILAMDGELVALPLLLLAVLIGIVSYGGAISALSPVVARLGWRLGRAVLQRDRAAIRAILRTAVQPEV